MNRIQIRKGVSDDCPAIFHLFKELLEVEKITPDHTIDESTLLRDGFGQTPIFETLVAEIEDQTGKKELAGFGIYFYHYSVFSGRTVFVEAIYVKAKHQNKGIGKQLWKSMVQAGLENECARCIFHVFGWNTRAVQFYKKCGAADFTADKDEHIFHMTKDNMVQFVSS